MLVVAMEKFTYRSVLHRYPTVTAKDPHKALRGLLYAGIKASEDDLLVEVGSAFVPVRRVTQRQGGTKSEKPIAELMQLLRKGD